MDILLAIVGSWLITSLMFHATMGAAVDILTWRMELAAKGRKPVGAVEGMTAGVIAGYFMGCVAGMAVAAFLYWLFLKG